MNSLAGNFLAWALLMALPDSLSVAEEFRLVPVEDCTSAFAADDINISMRIVGNTTRKEHSAGRMSPAVVFWLAEKSSRKKAATSVLSAPLSCSRRRYATA